MAIEVLWDTITNAEVAQHVSAGRRIVRTAFVSGLTADVTSAKFALLDAIEAAAPEIDFGAPFDETLPSYRCVFRVARAVENMDGTMARLWAHFETPSGGTPIERFTMEDLGALVSEPVNLIPGSLEPMLCSLDNDPPNLLYETYQQRPTVKIATASHPHNYRSIVLYGLFSERPPLALLNAGNTVNHATWQSRPRGHWRMEPPRVAYSSRDGMFSVTVGLLSKGDQPGEDWSTYSLVRDDQGELVRVSNSTMETLRGQTYEYGRRWNRRGIYKFGGYRVTNFSTLLGDEFPIGD